MATQVKHRRGTSSEIAAFTPAVGELVVDIETNELVLGDGVKLGGHKLRNKDTLTTLQDFIADEKLEIGQHITTGGYNTAGDGGDGGYVVVAYGTGTVDGGSFVNTNNGLQLKLIHEKDVISLRQFGAVMDGVNDDYPSYVAAKTYIGDGTIKITGDSTTVCFFASYPNAAEILVGPLFDVDEGVEMRIFQSDGLTVIYGNSTIRVTRDTTFYETLTDTYAYISPQTSARVQSKLNWLNASDSDMTTVSAYDMTSEITAKKVDWDGSGDTFDPDIYSATTQSSIQLNTVHDGFIHLGMVKLDIGDTLTSSVSAFNSTDSGVTLIARCEGGYYGVRGSNVTPVITVFSKLIGQARVEVNENNESSPFSQNRFPVSNLSIKLLDIRTVAFCINGIEQHRFDTDSDVLEVGIGCYDLGVSATILTMDDFVKIKSLPSVNGVRGLSFAIFGDSISAGPGVQHVYGSWPEYMRLALDGVNGVRVKPINNFAVSGATSGTQLPLVTPGNLAGNDYAMIQLGTNDIQGGVSLAVYLSNMQTIIQTCLDEGVRPIVGIPPMFYAQSDAATVTGISSGNATTNTAGGSTYRSGLVRLCATMGVKVVDVMGGLGGILALYLDTDTYLDSTVTDNIHPSIHGRALLGSVYAKAVIGDLSAGVNDSNLNVDFDVSVLEPGFAFTTTTPAYSLYYKSKQVYITGTIDVPAGLVGTSKMMTLPEKLRPTMSLRFVQFNGDGTYSMVSIDANGDVAITNPPAPATFVTLQINYVL